MLKLFLAELSYLKFNLHNMFFMISGMLLLSFLRGFNPINLVCWIIFIQFLSFTYLLQLRERRNYQYALLNISIKRIALYRIMLSVVGYIVVYLVGITLYMIFNFPHHNFHDTLLELLLFGGMALLGYYTYLFVSDFYSLFQSRSGFLMFNGIIGAIIFIVIILTALTVKVSYAESIEDGISSVILIYTGALIFAVISYIAFQHRESHLGY